GYGRNTKCRIFEHLVHADLVIVLIHRVWNDADIEGADRCEEIPATQVASECHLLGHAERPGKRLHRGKRWPVTDNDRAHILPTTVMDDVRHHANEMIDAVLIGDDTEIAEHHRSTCPQFTIGLDTPELLPVGHAIDRGDVFRRPAAALDGDIAISVVRGYHPVGEPEGAFLRQQQKPM